MRPAVLALLGVLASTEAAPAPQAVVRVGAIGNPDAVQANDPNVLLTRYLESRLPEYRFTPVFFADRNALIRGAARGELDFARVNAAVFVQLEVEAHAVPVATALYPAGPSGLTQQVGAAVFCRAESGIGKLADLRGKRLAASFPQSLAGSLAALRELKSIGMEAGRDYSVLYTGGTPRLTVAVASAVSQGRADCGVLPSDIMEQAFQLQILDRRRTVILPPPRPYLGIGEYHLATSTRLYPASPFVAMRHVSPTLSRDVATALFTMPVDPSEATGAAAWSLALNYQPVHECMRELGVAPYEGFGRVTLRQAIRQHAPEALLAAALILAALLAFTIRVLVLNRQLRASRGALLLELEQHRLDKEALRLALTKLEESQVELHRLNEELEGRVVARTSQLANANRELESFSYSVSHDLRAPLRAVEGFAAAAAKDPGLSPAGARHLQLVQQGAQRMSDLIDALLEFSRLSQEPLRRCPVSMDDLVRRVVTELQLESSAHLVIDVRPLAACAGDPRLLLQVWQNLLSNAAKFTGNRADPRIEVRCETVAGETAYVVADNGAGFDMAYGHKLFGVFQRLHSPQEFQGTGIGLATVQRIVHRHGGRVWAEGRPDAGATFRFTVPAPVDGPERQPLQRDQSPRPTPS